MKKRLTIILTTIVLVVFIIVTIELNIFDKKENLISKREENLQSENIIENNDIEENVNNQIEYTEKNNDDNNNIVDNIIILINDNYKDESTIDIYYDNEQTKNSEYYQSSTKEVFNLVNQIRIDNNLQPLIWNDSLEQSAIIRAQEIINTFDHTRPNETPWYTTININYRYAGENIAAGQNTPQIVVDEWMASEGHKANILNPNFTEMGVALYYNSNNQYKYNWVQLFVGY